MSHTSHSGLPRTGSRFRTRQGAVMPLFAVLLPVLLIFAGFAINMAYMQLVATELKITTDCAAHAGGRAMSVAQGDDSLNTEQKRQKAINDGIAMATRVAQANPVVGHVLSVGTGDDDAQIKILFGRSVRGNNGYGMYEFTETPVAEVLNGDKRPSSLAVVGSLDLPMVFNVMRNGAFTYNDLDGQAHSSPARHVDRFTPLRRSVATQVDRDIALVLDRSGSMIAYRDDDGMDARLRQLYESTYEVVEPGGWMYHYYSYSRWSGWRDRGYYRPEDARGSWTVFDYSDRRWDPETTRQQRRISYGEYEDATRGSFNRRFTDNVVYQFEAFENPSHTLGDSFDRSESGQLTSMMAAYAADLLHSGSSAPRYSRWWYLEQGVDAFLNVLDITDQKELVSLVTFNSSATLEMELQEEYSGIRSRIDGIYPNGGTAIGDGMATGLPPIIDSEKARPFAAKTIVVLTDGINNAGQDPLEAVEGILARSDVTVHTVTFTLGADRQAMQSVAQAGRGRSYHANDGSALIEIFEEIANNLPTILTE